MYNYFQYHRIEEHFLSLRHPLFRTAGYWRGFCELMETRACWCLLANIWKHQAPQPFNWKRRRSFPLKVKIWAVCIPGMLRLTSKLLQLRPSSDCILRARHTALASVSCGRLFCAANLDDFPYVCFLLCSELKCGSEVLTLGRSHVQPLPDTV